MVKKPKILICGILPPPYFGHSMIYKMLMQSEFVRVFDIVFFNMKFWSYETHKKVTFLKIVKLIGYFFRYLFLIISRRPTHILYNMSFDKMPFLKDYFFCLTGRIFGCRIILHDMGQYLRELYDQSGPLYRSLIRHLLKITTASIVLGENTRGVYEGFLDLKKVFSVPGSVEDTQENVSDLPDLKKEKKNIHVLYFSFLTKSKGIWTALEAVPRVIEKNKNVVFTFAGPIESTALKNEIDVFIKNRHLEAFVQCTGYIGDERERIAFYRQSDIFIFPSHRDVFGLVILHAMAEGMAVVASREGAIPEIVEEGKTGFLFAKGDFPVLAEKILTLAANEKLRRAMGEAGRRRYADFYTPKEYGERMIKAFRLILELN